MYLKKSKCFSLLIGVIITLLLCFSSVAGAGVTNGPENPPVQSQQVSVVESTYPEAQGKSEIKKLQEEIYKKGFNFKVKDNWVTELSPEERKTLFGFIPPKAPAQLPAGMGFVNLKQKDGMYGAEALPSEYDAMALGYVTPVKNQANCGSCWIFGAVADLESDVLIKENKTFDFSEQEVGDCHFWQRVADRSFCEGGNSLWTTDYFTQYGSAMESCHPYKAAPDGCKNCPLIKNVTNGRYITFNDGEGQIEAIKAAILNYGPVQSCLYAGDPAFGAYDGGVYEYWEPGETNHLIQIIGWDDSLKHSQGTGAWLIKNSWSTKWGAHGPYPGCGWVAYKSANLGDFTFAISDYKEAQDTIYYHDEGGFVGTAAGCNKPTAWGAVRFIPAKDASLNAVDFWTPDVNMNYEIKIFDQINQGYTLSNQLGVTQTGSTKEVGYYSLPLTKPIPLQKGNDFIVQVKFTTTTGYPYPVPVDYDAWDLWYWNVVYSGDSYISCDGNKFGKACFDDLCLDLNIRARAAVEQVEPLKIITPSPLPEGKVNQSYDQKLEAKGGVPPYGWSLTAGNLPPGLNLSGNGLISGTPTKEGSYNFTVQVKDTKEATDKKEFSLKITAGPIPETVVEVGKESGLPGQSIALPVDIKKVKDLCGAKFELNYDPKVAVATAAEKGSLVKDFLFEANLKEADKGKIILGMMGTNGVSGSGNLAKITFKLVGNRGDETPVKILGLELNDCEGNEIPALGVDGKITIRKIICGDVSGDDKVNVADATLVLRHAVGLYTIPPDRLWAADVNCDGKINVADATLVLRYAVGLINQLNCCK